MAHRSTMPYRAPPTVAETTSPDPIPVAATMRPGPASLRTLIRWGGVPPDGGAVTVDWGTEESDYHPIRSSSVRVTAAAIGERWRRR